MARKFLTVLFRPNRQVLDLSPTDYEQWVTQSVLCDEPLGPYTKSASLKILGLYSFLSYES